MPVVNHWFQIHYARPDGRRAVELVTYTGASLQSVLDRISVAQAGRLRYDPRGPRIMRIAAVAPPALDAQFKMMLDAVLRLENTLATETL